MLWCYLLARNHKNNKTHTKYHTLLLIFLLLFIVNFLLLNPCGYYIPIKISILVLLGLFLVFLKISISVFLSLNQVTYPSSKLPLYLKSCFPIIITRLSKVGFNKPPASLNFIINDSKISLY